MSTRISIDVQMGALLRAAQANQSAVRRGFVEGQTRELAAAEAQAAKKADFEARGVQVVGSVNADGSIRIGQRAKPVPRVQPKMTANRFGGGVFNVLFLPKQSVGGDWLADYRAGTNVLSTGTGTLNAPRGSTTLQIAGGPYASAPFARVTGANDAYGAVEFNDSFIGKLGGNAFTMEFWAKATGTLADFLSNNYGAGVVLRNSDYTKYLDFFCKTGGTIGNAFYEIRLSAQPGSGGSRDLSFIESNFQQDWNHVAMVVNGTEVRFYLNGAQVGPEWIFDLPMSQEQWDAFWGTDITFVDFYAFAQTPGGTGSIHGARVVGAAIYDGPFTPPEFQ